jgi:hypothetical protein
MMQVWVVRMAMNHRRMPVGVNVHLPGRFVGSVLVLVVLVMRVGMLVHHLVVLIRRRGRALKLGHETWRHALRLDAYTPPP